MPNDTARGFDAALIEAMARAMCQQALGPKQCPCWGKAFKCADAHPSEQATAALTALCAARPDVAALLAGEAVAVPREATPEMCASFVTGQYDPIDREACAQAGIFPKAEHEWAFMGYRAMLAASPYAKEPHMSDPKTTPAPTLHGDGIHNDAPALEAMRRGEPVQTRDPETTPDLSRFGWAPGGYTGFPCRDCKQRVEWCAKRSWRCQPCAQKAADEHERIATAPMICDLGGTHHA